jgi:hypothetical protein
MVPLVAAGAALLLMLWVIWHRHVRCVDLIEAELRRYHFTGISASVAWGRVALHSYTYNVRYQDTRGRRHRNRARVSVRAEDEDAVHWQHRLERPSSQRKTVDDDSDMGAGVTVEGRLPLITDSRGRHASR